MVAKVNRTAGKSAKGKKASGTRLSLEKENQLNTVLSRVHGVNQARLQRMSAQEKLNLWKSKTTNFRAKKAPTKEQKNHAKILDEMGVRVSGNLAADEKKYYEIKRNLIDDIHRTSPVGKGILGTQNLRQLIKFKQNQSSLKQEGEKKKKPQFSKRRLPSPDIQRKMEANEKKLNQMRKESNIGHAKQLKEMGKQLRGDTEAQYYEEKDKMLDRLSQHGVKRERVGSYDLRSLKKFVEAQEVAKNKQSKTKSSQKAENAEWTYTPPKKQAGEEPVDVRKRLQEIRELRENASKNREETQKMEDFLRNQQAKRKASGKSKTVAEGFAERMVDASKKGESIDSAAENEAMHFDAFRENQAAKRGATGGIKKIPERFAEKIAEAEKRGITLTDKVYERASMEAHREYQNAKRKAQEK